MPSFGKSSRDRLSQCHPDLQILMNEVIKHIDCSIICGHRTKEDQQNAFDTKKSQVQWPNSKHNSYPSKAVDVAPWPIDWSDISRFRDFGMFVLGVAAALRSEGKIKSKIRWGADWNRNYSVDDERFKDFPHFEIDD